ncbi:MAG: nucleoside 2-deoxyribosyltransferase [Clostridia bacterium]|nr:nucleoside 2-deoxyribosyltransferase [Clostridia bacterium]
MNDNPIVFVIMPFSEDFLALYGKLKEEFRETFTFTSAGDLDSQQSIIKDIVQGIHKADVIIADLTNLNANVFYELGLAHAMNKKVIIITQCLEELPFDIRSYRANEYSLKFNKLPELIEKLKCLLSGAIDGSVEFGKSCT